MRLALLQEAGAEEAPGGVRTTAVQYFRQQLMRRSTGPAQRELFTLCSTVDLILKGKVAMALDVLIQRIKSSESTLLGNHWQTSQRMEVLDPELLGIAGVQEVGLAQRETYNEAKLRRAAAAPEGRPGAGKGSNSKGKDGRKEGKGDKGKDSKGKGHGGRGDRAPRPGKEEASG